MSLPTFRVPALAGLLAAAAFLPPSASAQTDNFDARARQIVSQMTLDEKISQMHGTSDKKEYRIVLGVPRLNIPDLLVTNGPAGFGPAGPGHSGKATALPAPIALAATWDLEASRDYGTIAGRESFQYGNTLLESPDINIARVPQNGRTFEAYGEDPFLVGRLSVAHILAVQKEGVIANVKHYAANNQEDGRRSINVEVDERTLREIYLPAFEASIKEGKSASLMGAYNKVNGAHCCENDVLLNQILKKEWGFDGFVTSDFGAVHSTVPSVLNGLDLEMPTGQYFGGDLKKAVEGGQVPVAVIDEHLVRRFRTMMKIGVWDHLPEHKPIAQKENGERARQIAEEGMVLLRNEKGLLPLDPASLKTVALIGPYAMKPSTGGGGSSKVDPIYTVGPLDGLQQRLGSGVKVTLNEGKDPAAAAALAKACDVAIVMVGDQQSEGKDHPIEFAGNQNALVAAVAAANPRTVVVNKSGGPMLMPWAESVPAILQAWYPGEEDGNAVAAVLCGDFDPSGKLPITFPKAVADEPTNTPRQYPGEKGEGGEMAETYSEGVLVGYRWYDAKKIAPLYPFGYGLSYTAFAYKNVQVSTKELTAANPAVTLDFDVVNTGGKAGAEVAQVYVGLPSLPGVSQPPRQLKGFARVNVAPGQTAHAQVKLDARAFSYWDVGSHGWKVAPGEYPISVGASSRDLKLNASVTVR